MSDPLDLFMQARDAVGHLESELELIDICLEHLSNFSDEGQAVVNLRRTGIVLEHFKSFADCWLENLQNDLKNLHECFMPQGITTGDEAE
jgi:hypothetical protein